MKKTAVTPALLIFMTSLSLNAAPLDKICIPSLKEAIAATDPTTPQPAPQAQPAAPIVAAAPAPINIGKTELGKRKIEFGAAIIPRFQANSSGRYLPKTDQAGNRINWLDPVNGLDIKYRNYLRDAVRTAKEYVLTVANYFLESNDAHTSVELESTLTNATPFDLAVVNGVPTDPNSGNFVISFINSGFTPTTNQRTPVPGDQVTAINSMTPDNFRKMRDANGHLVMPQFNSLGKENSSRKIFGLELSLIKEARGARLANLGSTITYRIHPQDGSPDYDITYNYKVQGVGIIDKPLLPGQPLPAPAVLKATNDGQSNQIKSESDQVKLNRRTEKRAPLLAANNPGTWKIFNLFATVFRADVSHIVNDLDAPAKQGVGIKLGLGNQLPFYDIETFAPDWKRIEIPDSKTIPGLKEMMNNDFFFAGTFKDANGKRAGFLRIPSYEPINQDTMLQSLRYFIGKLEAESDYLILDQTYNPGGLVLFSDFVVKSFVQKYDLTKHLSYSVRPTDNFLREGAEIIDEVRANLDGLLTDAQVQDFVARFTVEYNKVRLAAGLNKVDNDGNEIPGTQNTGSILPLSEPMSMTVLSDYLQITMDKIAQTQQAGLYQAINASLGMDVTQESAATFYTKPVIMAINDLDFSGGDATPASLQDYKRVYMVGEATAGAGGTVEAVPNLGITKIDVNHTTSAMNRLNTPASVLISTGQGLVEQKGVSVDASILLQSSDITSNGKTYFQSLMNLAQKYYQSLQKPH